MIKVTIQNVTRHSEDTLYIALADLKESDALYVVIEAELDRRNEAQTEALRRRQAEQLESLRLTQQMESEIKTIFDGFKGLKTLLLIENLGQEFIEDYTIDDETFTVFSKVSCEALNNPDTWEFDNIVAARTKVAQLIYNRVYNKFMRDVTKENLELLKRVLGE